jgi:hypothetical protein
MSKFLKVTLWLFGGFIGIILLSAVILQANTTPEYREQRRRTTDRDICAWRAGIRRETPLIYETTKALYYGGYVQCMLNCGHPILPLP